MSELATLRRLRASNAKLMNGNLSLLMSIREVDSEMQREWLQLQQHYELLARKGIAIPPSCQELMGTEEPETTMDDRNTSMASECPSNHKTVADLQPEQEETKPKRASVLSVRSVLNDDLSDPSESDKSSVEDS